MREVGEEMKKKFRLVTKNAGQEFFFEDEHFVLQETGGGDNEAIFHFVDKSFAERSLELHNALAGIEDVAGFMNTVRCALQSGYIAASPKTEHIFKEALALFPKESEVSE